MPKHAHIAVIVPAYNEERHIAATLRGLPSCVDSVWVIDDGSADATASAAQAVGDARVQVVRHSRNQGVGAALHTGYARAFEHGADIAVVMAGDNQMHPDDLPALLQPLLCDEADYTKGDRLAHPGAFARMPLLRFVGNHVLSLLTRIATGLNVSDSQCGYTAMHRSAYARLPRHALWTGYGYPNDLIGWLAAAGQRIRDVTVRPVYADERSGIRLRHALVVVPYVLARIVWRRALSRWSIPLDQRGNASVSVGVTALMSTEARMPPNER
jgi:glycosyltransferase involved in cell wall biosynthesis